MPCPAGSAAWRRSKAASGLATPAPSSPTSMVIQSPVVRAAAVTVPAPWTVALSKSTGRQAGVLSAGVASHRRGPHFRLMQPGKDHVFVRALRRLPLRVRLTGSFATVMARGTRLRSCPRGCGIDREPEDVGDEDEVCVVGEDGRAATGGHGGDHAIDHPARCDA